jgi:hypothetical protein
MMQGGVLAKGLLAVLVAGACLATSAEARHRRSWKWAEPPSAAPQLPTDATMENERRQREPNPPARFRRTGGVALVIDRVIRGCQQQSIELANWPFGTIAKVVAPDQDQSAALDQLRLAAQQAADTLTTACPQAVPGRTERPIRGRGAGDRRSGRRVRGSSAHASELLRETRR